MVLLEVDSCRELTRQTRKENKDGEENRRILRKNCHRIKDAFVYLENNSLKRCDEP